MIEQWPAVDLAPDPKDNFLLALAQAGGADYLVTGDQRDLLSIRRYQNTRIVTARQFLDEVLLRKSLDPCHGGPAHLAKWALCC